MDKEGIHLDRDEKRRRVARGILENCRNELYSYFPHLDGAFASVSYEPGDQVKGMGTQGDSFYYNSRFLLELYGREPAAVRRGYLHMLLHCLYLHLLREESYEKERWNLACDMAVEHMIHRENIGGLQIQEDPLRQQCFQQMGNRSLSAEELYEMLGEGEFPAGLEELAKVFTFDDHSLWDHLDSRRKEGLRAKWEKVQFYTAQNRKDQQKRRGSQRGTRREEAGEIGSGRYDYRKFLKQFAVLREEVELDTESFDYIFYNYGMEHYGNMPLIEPLEYKEVHRLEELVIAIDTSGSCSRETVQQFLAETYGILSQRENFFQKMKVHLVQCDCFLQEAQVIHSEEEWKDYSQRIQIQGRGGTDFRPVFEYVKEQQKKRELINLKALIYFTDGDGIYPQCRPDYETAFVFLHKTEKMELVPPWALRLVTGESKSGTKERMS